MHSNKHPTDIAPETGLKRGTFGIGTFELDGKTFPGLVRANGEALDLTPTFADTLAIFADWERNFARLVDIDANGTPLAQYAKLRALPPIARPNVYFAGANYKQHSAEMLTKNKFNQHNRLSGESDAEFFKRNYALMERRAREGTPFIFIGPHSSLIGAHENVLLPVLGEQPDWELELCAVIGKTGRYRNPEQAAKLVAGYTIINDLGTVDIFRRTDVPFGFDWIGKFQPTFKPVGPFIVPAPFIELTDQVKIHLQVNGVTRQNWPVTDMIFAIPQLVAYMSERLNLQPGDLMATGSPPGNGASWGGAWLQDGDVMESEITYLGRQRNVCVKEPWDGQALTFGLWKND